MRRITQVRVTDWTVRILVTARFLAYFSARRRWVLLLMPICVAAVGVWVVLYPEGVLGWAKTAHPDIDVNDISIWWAPRLIGAFFLFLALLLAFAFRG